MSTYCGINKNVKYYLLSICFVAIGNRIFSFSLSYYILQITNSGLSFTFSLALNYIPQIFILPIAGFVSDRFDKKSILFFCNFVTALFMLILYIAEINMFIIYSIIFFTSTISALFSVASESSIPFLRGVDSQEYIKNTLSYIQIIQSITSIFGPAIGGIVAAYINIKNIAIINISTLIISIISLLFISIRTNSYITSSKMSAGNQYKKTLKYIWSSSFLKTVFLTDCILNFCITLGLQSTFFYTIVSYFHMDSKALGIISSLSAIGSACAAWLIARSKNKNIVLECYPYKLALSFGIILLTLGAITFIGKNINIFVLIVLFCSLQFTFGFFLVKFNISITLTVQATCERDLLGSITGLMHFFSMLLIPASLIISGALMGLLPLYEIQLFSGLLFCLSILILYKKCRT